jgi:hypothetical protein
VYYFFLRSLNAPYAPITAIAAICAIVPLAELVGGPGNGGAGASFTNTKDHSAKVDPKTKTFMNAVYALLMIPSFIF